MDSPRTYECEKEAKEVWFLQTLIQLLLHSFGNHSSLVCIGELIILGIDSFSVFQ